MNFLYPEVAQRANHRCEYCHAPETAFNMLFEVEHITPSARGGSDTLDNLALACRACNAFKSVRQTGLDPETQVVCPLFHPRDDLWDNHFTVDLSTNAIIGNTPKGRTTVVALQLNHPLQLQARQHWRRLELFP
jgi:hypothetical protein